MFEKLFTEALAQIPRFHYHPKKQLQFRAFDVTKDEYPDDGQLADGLWDAVVITGSRASARPGSAHTQRAARPTTMRTPTS